MPVPAPPQPPGVRFGAEFIAEKEPRTFPGAGKRLEKLWSQAAWDPIQVLFLIR